MRTKSIIAILIAIMLMSMTASAYVPPELRTGTYMSELDIVKVALAEHDAGRDSRWVKYTLEDATEELTNTWYIGNNYNALRQWVIKINSQKQPISYNWIEPPMDAGWQGPGSN